MLEIGITATFNDAEQRAHKLCPVSLQGISAYSGRHATVANTQYCFVTQSKTYVACSYSMECTHKTLSEKKVYVIQLQGFFSRGGGGGDDSNRSRIPDCKNCGSFTDTMEENTKPNLTGGHPENVDTSSLRDHCFYMQGCTDCFRDGDISVVEEPPLHPIQGKIIVVPIGI